MVGRKTATELAAETELQRLADAMQQPMDDKLIDLLDKSRALEKWPLAQLISLFERNHQDSLIGRHQIISHIAHAQKGFEKEALIVGMTGTPGAGKSSLIGALCLELLEALPNASIAVLAIDPSSEDSGGALLGDRTRTRFPVDNKRLYFRSQASHQDLGGMGKSTFHVVRLLRHLFDFVFIETVGIGQSETEIRRLSDHTCLVMQPLAGDQVQFLKAGIMEIPDSFVVNKCDEEALAKRSLHLLRSSLKLGQVHGSEDKVADKPVIPTSATTGKGIDALARHMKDLLEQRQNQGDGSLERSWHDREQYFLRKWIMQAWGEFGLGVLDHYGEHAELTSGTLEQKELAFSELISAFIRQLN